MDALCFRVSTERQTTENQSIYVEQGRSGRTGSKLRPLFQRMKNDAAARKFSRPLVWKVSRLGRNMRDVIDTVYQLNDLGVTVVPVKFQTGPIDSTLGKLLWAIQARFAEMENDEKADAIKAGQVRARAAGKHVGRPRLVFDRQAAVSLRQNGHNWHQIAARLNISVTSARRAVGRAG